MKTTHRPLKLLDEKQACKLICDARIVALRWDIIPWTLVLDLDVPTTEAEDAPLQRAWIVFHGLSSVSFSFSNARIPVGINVISEMWIERSSISSDLKKASFQVIYTQGNQDSNAGSNQSQELVIVAEQIFGMVSLESSLGQNGLLAWDDRIGLASDSELRAALNQTVIS